MEKTRIIFNKLGNTLDIWFGNPKKEAISEEADEEVILKKDKNGKIIGIEKLNFIQKKHKDKEGSKEIPVQLIMK